MSLPEHKVVFWVQTNGFMIKLWILAKNCIFGDAIPVRLAPLEISTFGYKIHCRSENGGSKTPKKSIFIQRCPKQANQPILYRKNWKYELFRFSEKRPFLG